MPEPSKSEIINFLQRYFAPVVAAEREKTEREKAQQTRKRVAMLIQA